MKRYCLALDLHPDPSLMEEYVRLHKSVQPVIQKSIRDAGVIDMQIFMLGNHLFMIMDTVDDFTFEKKAAMDAANPAVQEWERLVSQFQNVDPEHDPSGKWRVMEQIFQLDPA
ncbi:hypothetical protein Terro_2914 [Terriglobus roseus DSM 18391]|uniref:L-rhamnose mutarotase n=1 Tax=Terriglobus roseus (strain DSM 18391 / NRRL B-41598 / KBS 63) TaxID=926566 RepID=I3ZIT1_TERRK|nr:L-rhamnose mutarotase [Terriglobus roseus]AFL89149.1 hypothetical protein Terro_2914 [Terriglobus roseus DSM 18391]